MNRSRRAGAAAVSVTAAVAAAAALGSGLDRLSRSHPQVAPLVPESFRSQAWRKAAAGALGQGRGTAARAGAEAAVRADPADPAAVSLLGLVRLAANDAAGADAAFRVSGSLGWRDMPTQLYWLSVAPAIGDHPVAAERADAILRQNAAVLEQPQFLAALEATPAGRSALAARLASRPPWFAEYWNRTFTLPPARLVQRAAVLDAPELRRARLTCADVRGLATRLAQSGYTNESRHTLQRFCPGARAGLVDGGFERARLDATSPAGWQFVGTGGVGLRLVDGDGRAGGAVTVISSLPYRVVFATQQLQLAPGRYRVAWRTREDDGATSPRIAVRLDCRNAVGEFFSESPAMVEVDAACPDQMLELAILPGAGSVAVDDVAVTPLR